MGSDCSAVIVLGAERVPQQSSHQPFDGKELLGLCHDAIERFGFDKVVKSGLLAFCVASSKYHLIFQIVQSILSPAAPVQFRSVGPMAAV